MDMDGDPFVVMGAVALRTGLARFPVTVAFVHAWHIDAEGEHG